MLTPIVMEPMSNRTSARRDVATANCLVRIRGPGGCELLEQLPTVVESQMPNITTGDDEHIERNE